jgi:hypothetical protein
MSCSAPQLSQSHPTEQVDTARRTMACTDDPPSVSSILSCHQQPSRHAEQLRGLLDDRHWPVLERLGCSESVDNLAREVGSRDQGAQRMGPGFRIYP